MNQLKAHHLAWLAIDWCDFLEAVPVPRSLVRQQVHQGKRWYVYILWRDDLGVPVPFYVGKGTRGRLLQHTAPSDRYNRYKAALLSKMKRSGTPIRYSIAGSFDDEPMALMLEIDLITKIGRAELKDGPLTNRTEGGDGTRGHLAKSGGESASARPVVAGGISFSCLGDAALSLGVTSGAVSQRITNGWIGYYYADEGQRSQKDGVLGRYRRQVMTPAGIFDSMSQAEQATGESVKSIYKRVRAGWPGYFYPEEGQRPRRTHEKPCSIDGEFYPSQNDAAKAKGITIGSLAKRLRSSNFSAWVDLTGDIDKEVKEPPKAQRLSIDGVSYEAAAAASSALGIKPATILFRLRSSNYPTYVGDAIGKVDRDPNLAKGAVSVSVDGVGYSTLSEASEALGIDISTLKRRCTSPSFPTYESDDPQLRVRQPKDGRAGLIQVVVGDRTFRSINAASAATGEPRALIRRRLDDPAQTSYRRVLK